MEAKTRNKILGMLAIGLGLPNLLMPNLQAFGSPHYCVQITVSLVVTVLLWEGNLRIQCLLNEKYPWDKNAFKRITTQLIVSGLFSNFVVLATIACMAFVVKIEEFTLANLIYHISLATIMVILITAIYEGNFFFNQWKSALTKAQRLEKESVEAKYEALKNQVNPHFLFNSLNTLTNVISDNENEKAIDFIQNLSNVYRYILQSRNKDLVELKVEMKIVDDYIYLLQSRFEDNLLFEWDLQGEPLNSKIPPLTLQMLVENAIKHNVVSSLQPLKVTITIDDHQITVRNNLQKKSVMKENSTSTGLDNIKKRYQLLTKELVEIEESSKYFTVTLPVIQNEKI